MRAKAWVLAWIALLALGLALFVRPRLPEKADAALPEPYARLERALSEGDREALRALAREPSYAALLAARALAEDEALSAFERAHWSRFVLKGEGEGARLWAAAVLEEVGAADEAARLYRAELLKPEAVAGLLRLAREGSQEAVAGLLAAGRYEAALRYAQDPRLKGRALLALGHAEKALSYFEGSPRDRGRALEKLGRKEAALKAYREAGDRLAEGRLLLDLGRKEEALAALLSAGERGRFWAAGTLEATDPARAVEIYLELASLEGPLADDAALRAYLLAKRLDDEEAKDRAYGLLSGGLALLIGKPLGTLRVEPLPERAPEGFETVRALWEAGHPEWALGEAAYRARAAEGEARRAWAWVLYALGDVRQAARFGGLRLKYATPWREEVLAEARARGLDPWLLYAVMRVESAFDPGAVSPTGAQGLFQFTAATWREVRGWIGRPEADPKDPKAAIAAGAAYLAWLLRYFDGDLRLAVVAYNGGPGYVRRGMERYGDFFDFLRFQPRDEPREYLAKVWRDYAIYRALANVSRTLPAFLEGFPPEPR